MLECRSMKRLDESHIFITEKNITRKLICVRWGTGKYLKDCSGILPEWQAKVKYIIVTSQVLPIPEHNKDKFSCSEIYQ